MKTCKFCKIEKELTEFSPCGTYKDKIYYRGECKDCNLKVQSSDQTAQLKYRKSNKGKINKQRHKKTEKYLRWQRHYESSRYKRDAMYKLKKNLRRRLTKALEAKSWLKNTHFAEYIGCDEKTLKKHIEDRFIEGMTWGNHGFGDGFWNIDHVIPLSGAQTPEEMYKLCHYSNLQPLWHKDNQKKSDHV